MVFKNIFKSLNVAKCLIALSLLNILDGALTIFWINHGLAEEANPIMKEALALGDLEFLLIKFSIVSLSCLTLYQFRRVLLSQMMTLVGLTCYIALIFYHALCYIHFVNVP